MAKGHRSRPLSGMWIGKCSDSKYTSFCSLEAHIHGGSSVESDFEPGTLRPQSRDLVTKPPQPPAVVNRCTKKTNSRYIYKSSWHASTCQLLLNYATAAPAWRVEDRIFSPSKFPSLHSIWKGRSGLVVKSRLWGRRVPGSKLDSTEDPPCIWACCTLNLTLWPNVLPLVWCGSLERGCKVRCRPRHLTWVQNDEVLPKIVLLLLQNETLI
ncbi:hypothetical protein AVEN_51242-1 [Araneus ventricosus]|uniref:Uncharacterized protein n=1 Tax=Araneus ventricosus TaxID=182803 RepID=A0A4Y2LLJ6_ARAVE|nr:hypothetical protein AVEN_51242-1 [Araneus ventricosus]